MNFFYLDTDPTVCARSMVDKHIVKMITEHCQMMSAVQISHGIDALFKPTHIHHPCTVWVGASIENYNLLIEYSKAIAKEYTYRYGKVHASEAVLYYCEAKKPELPSIGITPIELCMPDNYKVSDPVESYRAFYRGAKRHIAKWKNRETPSWWY